MYSALLTASASQHMVHCIVCSIRLASNSQTRTGTDKGNPTV